MSTLTSVKPTVDGSKKKKKKYHTALQEIQSINICEEIYLFRACFSVKLSYPTVLAVNKASKYACIEIQVPGFFKIMGDVWFDETEWVFEFESSRCTSRQVTRP